MQVSNCTIGLLWGHYPVFHWQLLRSWAEKKNIPIVKFGTNKLIKAIIIKHKTQPIFFQFSVDRILRNYRQVGGSSDLMYFIVYILNTLYM